MKSFLFIFSGLALLALTKSLPCIGDSCGQLSPLYSEYDDDDGAVDIRDGSVNDASSTDDADNVKEPEKEDSIRSESPPVYEQQQQQKQRPNRQRLLNNYQQSLGPKPSVPKSYQSNQQSDSSTPYDENAETEQRRNPGRNNRGNNKSYNQGGNDGHNENGAGFNVNYPGSGNQGGNGGYNQNNGGGFNGNYPESGNQGGNRGHYQNNGGGFNRQYPGRGNQRRGGGQYQNNDNMSNGQYPGSGNQGGNGGYYQNNGGSYGRYPYRESSCPNCYATDFGNGEYNKNVINIEK